MATHERLASIKHWISSRRCVSVLKGALTYTLALMLPFLAGFDRFEVYPASYSAMIIVTIACFPGRSTGEALESTFFALLGVTIGAGNFAILAKLRSSLPAQAVVFVIMVYFLALLKAYNIKYFGMSLLAILMTFNGVYTSILTGAFIPTYLESYIKSYFWGGALVVGVNIFVFPESSEKQLRQTLVTSLDHISIFLHLLAKTYTVTITDEERKVRDGLNQSIRADFGLLNAKAEATTIEINWSRWSTEDYRDIITQTRKMQLGLIAMYSSLIKLDNARGVPGSKGDGPLFRKHFLPSTIASFHRLRRDTQRTIFEIQKELSGGCSRIWEPGRSGYEVFFDLEKQELGGGEEGTSDQTEEPVIGLDGDRQLGPDTKESPVPQVSAAAASRPQPTRFVSSLSIAERLRVVSDRLAQEVELKSPATVSGSTDLSSDTTPYPDDIDDGNDKKKNGKTAPKVRGSARLLKLHFHDFEKKQLDLLTEAVCSGELYGNDPTLRVREPRPSVWDTWGPDHIRGHVDGEDIVDPATDGTHGMSSGKASNTSSLRKRKVERPGTDNSGRSGEFDVTARMEDPDSDDDNGEPEPEDPVARTSNESLMRVFAMIFALDSFTSNLALCHAIVTRKDSHGRSRKRLRFHFFEGLRKPHRHHIQLSEFLGEHPSHTASPQTHDGEMNTNAATADPALTSHVTSIEDPPSGDVTSDLSMKEALALLEGKEYVPDRPGFWLRLSRLEDKLHTPISIYAGKVAGACLVFAILIWADHTRHFFLTYGIQGSLLTVAVALSPTLGQSVRTFVLQIIGSSVGYLLGLAFLEMFKNVGGYHYNPYGVTCMVGLFSLPASWLLYERPQYFTGVLLGMNACGVLVISQWVQVVHLHNKAYGEPPIRVGRSLAGLAIALGIVLIFQLVVLRNPARRTLRKQLAYVMYSELSYITILQAFMRGMMPTEAGFRPPTAAVKKVIEELVHREHKIQGQILAVMPLIAFSKDEPQWSKPFQAGEIMKIVRASQIILDRLRDARYAVGHKGFSENLLKSIIRGLSPYRKRLSRQIKNHLCLISASIMSKTPLPHDTMMENWVSQMTHDALVLSQRFAQTAEGRASMASGEFTRYWFYILSISSIAEQVQAIEECLRKLYGQIEDDHRLW